MVKGGHIFCSSELVKCEDIDNILDAETATEEQKLMAVIILKRSDEARYKKLLSDLKDGSNLSRDEYPITVAGAFDLLNRTSGQLDNSRNNGPRGQIGEAKSNLDGH